ncbi:hypothetical protein KCH_03230 [Kitasatospora cheerisanensis KCTC 2395]|uniref:Uncharacterized protein n=1 Tax=Kitasatospora cheerisanensis KCTC 2395 TaxID=1348663 RepID=A0A066ZCN2_9ACTN|nr:hypothetical protein KCH_03230 [Kitasatospora cheerisanensis KCTC 2395]
MRGRPVSCCPARVTLRQGRSRPGGVLLTRTAGPVRVRGGYRGVT